MMVGPWRVDPSLNRLIRNGTEIRVERKVMLLLLVLARAPGRPVERQQLLDELWGYHVSDDALHTVVAKLRRALDHDGVKSIETVPKVGYRLLLPVGDDEVVAPEPDRPNLARRWNGGLAAVAITICVAGAGVWWSIGRVDSGSLPSARISPLTSDPGLQVHPALSPGAGDKVAYVSRQDSGNWELFVRGVGDSQAIRLTHSPVHEHYPAWSRDATQLAVVRYDEHRCTIWTMSPQGGSERAVADCPATDLSGMEWTDGALLVTARRSGEPYRAYRVSLDGTATSPITSPPAASVGDVLARLSPDGRTLAVAFSPALGAQDLYLLPVGGGERRRITFDDVKIHGFDWVSDGQSLVFSSNRSGLFSLWRIPVAGPGALEQLSPSGDDLDAPTVSADGRRVVYERWTTTTSIVSRSLANAAPQAPVSLLRWMWHLDVSATGTRAFVSDRSGSPEVWTAGPGGELTQVTRRGGPYVSTPRWSPDGRSLAFVVNGRLHVADLASGAERPLTVSTGSHEVRTPAWSTDGQVLYFASNHGGAWEIWRMPSGGGSAEQVTSGGGTAPRVSPDGQRLYYARPGLSGIWSQPIGGGDVRQDVTALAPVDHLNWTVTPGAIYFIRRVGEDAEIWRHDLALGRARQFAPVAQFFAPSGLAVSADEQTWWHIRVDQQDADLMLWERPVGQP